jgi:hypothetical protein
MIVTRPECDKPIPPVMMDWMESEIRRRIDHKGGGAKEAVKAVIGRQRILAIHYAKTIARENQERWAESQKIRSKST